MIDESQIEMPVEPVTEIVIPRGENAFHAAYQALQNRVAAALGQRPEVLYSAYPCRDELPFDNLDEIAIKGRCRLEQPYDDYWGTGTAYQSEELVDPTWLQLTCLADAMIRTTGDRHHVFLEDVRLVRREGDVMIYRFSMGS